MKMIPTACPTCGSADHGEKPAPGELRRIRRAAGLTYKQLAALLEERAGERVSVSYLSNNEAPPPSRPWLPAARIVELYAALEAGAL